MNKLFLSIAFFTLPTVVAAQSMDSIQKAQQLGSILASEKFCDLTYDQDAISAWIDENTDPSDMGFASSLSMMTEGAAYGFADMSDSGKTAHCRSVSRTAKHFKFVG